MSPELVMNTAGTIGHSPGSIITGGTFVISTAAASVKCKAEGAGIYREPFQYTFSGGSSAGFDSGSIATLVSQIVSSGATKTRADGQLVIRLGDSGTMIAQGTVSGTPTLLSDSVEVTAAGQTTVRAQ